MSGRPGPVGAWLRAARPLAHANIAPPIALGMAFAHALRSEFSVRMAAVGFGFGVLNHLGIVFMNDLADRETDAMAQTRTPFSGGSRVIPDGLITASALRNAAITVSVLLLLGSAVAGWA
ncbi:MAG TPA: prenyltransferase, partial [Polyangiaceae bacterium]|nr:prenyltransferase [Polyangiaceae bacterium]